MYDDYRCFYFLFAIPFNVYLYTVPRTLFSITQSALNTSLPACNYYNRACTLISKYNIVYALRIPENNAPGHEGSTSRAS